MICQGCGVEAPTKYVSFHQNVGALVARFSKSVEGRLEDLLATHRAITTNATVHWAACRAIQWR